MIYLLSHVSFKMSCWFKIFGCFLNFLLLLISSSVLVKEHISYDYNNFILRVFLIHSLRFIVVKAPLQRNVYSLVGCSILWTSIRSRWVTACSGDIFADFLGGVSCSTSSYKMLKPPTTIVELYIPPPFCSFNFCFMDFWSSVIRHTPIYDYYMFSWWLRW